VVTFPGFRVLADGSSVVLVTVSRKVAYQVLTTGHLVTVRLMGAYVDVQNNTNPLLTDLFPTPVRTIRLRPDKEGTSLVVELKQAATARERVVDLAGGSMVLELSFAAGRYPSPQAVGASTKLSIRSGSPPRRTGSRSR